MEKIVSMRPLLYKRSVKKGFLLVELLVALAVLGIVMITIVGSFGETARCRREIKMYLGAVNCMVNGQVQKELSSNKHDTFTVSTKTDTFDFDRFDQEIGFIPTYPLTIIKEVTVTWNVGSRKRSITSHLIESVRRAV